MKRILTVSREEIIQHIKLSCQIPAIAREVAIRRVITEAAAEAGIQVELEELQQAADNLRLVNNLLQAEDTWVWLQKYCLSLDEFEDLAYTNLISTKLAKQLSADKVESFFVEHYLDYAGAMLYEVVLDDADLAMELFYAIQEGEMSFSDVARQYIQEPELRRCGGYRGRVSRSDLKPEISAAVFAATPPQLLKPIITPKGAHLIQVEEIIQPQLDEPLRVKILADLFSNWLNQQIDQLDVRVQLEPAPLVGSSTQPNLVPNGGIPARISS
ncbi:MAG: peptidylprolyl isomerase [Kovacikia sp.]